MIYRIDETSSTNDDAKQARYREGDVIWAERQTAGRGQRGHTWSSAEGENLTFSVVLEPTFLPAIEQFRLSETVALALCDTFAGYGIDTHIKWTNDIYAGDRKLVGILIEHIYSGSKLARTVVGIGINVNQTEFPPELPNPVSMAQCTGKQFGREQVLSTFITELTDGYGRLRAGDRESVDSRYTARMYRLGERHTYALPDGTRFEGTIRGVRPTGDLLVEHEDGNVRKYLFKEIEFVIKGR